MSDTEYTPEKLATELADEGGEKLSWWLEEFRRLYEEGKSPKEAANEIYFEVEESPTDISLLLAMSVMYGVMWEKND